MPNEAIYGFHTLQNIFDRVVTDVNVTVIEDAIRQSFAFYNENQNRMLANLVERTTDYTARFRATGRARLQPIDVNSRPRATMTSFETYDVGWPLYMAGDAMGANYFARLRMTVGMLAEEVAAKQVADQDWLRSQMFAAMFTNVDVSFLDEESAASRGTITVKPLANADTQKYWYVQGSPSGATAQHFLAQANAIDDGADNPFPAITALLQRYPAQAGGPFVAMIPTNQLAAVQGLTTFFERRDPNLSAALGVTELVGAAPAGFPGEIIGYESSGIWISHWPFLPDNYIIALSGSGPRPLRMREDPEPSLRGFVPIAEREDWPWWERYWIRRAGFGAWNRTGAVIQRIGNGTYAVPANYTAPLP